MLEPIHAFLNTHDLPTFDPVLDGETHRPEGISHISYEGEKLDLNGEEAIRLRVHDFKQGQSFFYNTPHFANPDYLPTLEKLSKAQRAKQTELLKASHLKAKQEVAAYWETCQPIVKLPLYCERKLITPGPEARHDPECSDTLVLPMYDSKGEMWSVQKIYASGDKSFWPGSRTKGLFLRLAPLSGVSSDAARKSGVTYLAEGYATACTIRQASGAEVIAVFTASNLSLVARELAGTLTSPIIAADNDAHSALSLGYNPGLAAGMAASRALSCPLTYPTFVGCTPSTSTSSTPLEAGANPNKDLSDFNDLARISNLQTVKEQLMTDRRSDPDFIPSKDSGFYLIEKLKSGGLKHVPQYDDLLKYFDQRHSHKTTEHAAVYVYGQESKTYRPMTPNEIETFASEHFNPKPSNQLTVEFRKRVEHSSLVGATFFNDSGTGLLNFPNGVLDVAEGTLHPHDPSRWGFTTCLDFDYDAEATCPRFDQFMRDVTSGDGDRETLLLEFMGYALSNDECWAEKILLLVGEGANGKSTFIRILASLVGPKAMVALNVRDFKNPFRKAELEGKFFNVCEEMPKRLENEVFEEIKNLASGGWINIERKFERPYSIQNKAKFVFACNQIPPSGDNTYGLLRKLIIVPFNATFTEKNGNLDRNLMATLKAERAGIFNRARDAYRALKARGHFVITGEAMEALETYKEELDPVADFLAEVLEKDSSRFNGQAEHVPWVAEHSGTHAVLIPKLFQYYREQAKIRGLFEYNIIEFGRRVARAAVADGLPIKKIKINGVSTRAILGASCKHSAEY